ncbi:MAG: hypothetical protein RLZZ488_2522 [Pseudomonadota bacterium]|jgi:tRNA U34 5-methylaminomethyl-2-thiouridine-forming methyltransferase MnmC
MSGDGNAYVLEVLDSGVASFRHLQTGELLHGSVGPEKEARDLYMAHSGLQESGKESLVVFDVGMGCGAQLLALLDFFHSPDSNFKKLQIFSFDLEKEGLHALLSASQYFDGARRYKSFIEQACSEDKVLAPSVRGKSLEWNFIGGDFRSTISGFSKNNTYPKADAIFFDFFSPASHPWLWTFDLFTIIRSCSHNQTRLITHSSATCVKAALAAAGWFVGHTIASGKKAKSIMAAGSMDELSDPLPAGFLATFERSGKPFCNAETEDSKKAITAALRAHPQFQK